MSEHRRQRFYSAVRAAGDGKLTTFTLLAFLVALSVAIVGTTLTEPVVSELVHQLRSSKVYDRVRAAVALADLGKAAGEAAPALAVALQDENSGVRLYAVQALGSIGDKRLADDLKKLMDDDDELIRDEVVRILSEWNVLPVPEPPSGARVITVEASPVPAIEPESPPMLDQRWEVVRPHHPSWEDFGDMFFLDAMYGWVISSGHIHITEDGGVSWESLPTTAPGRALTFVNKKTGFATSDLGKVATTVDGGKTWAQVYDPMNVGLHPGQVRDIEFLDSDTGIMVARFGQINITTNGGRSWENADVEEHTDVANGTYDRELYDVHFVDKLNGWAVGASVIYHTVDGGRTWHIQMDNLSLLSGTAGGFSLRHVQFVDRQAGWASGPPSSVNGRFNRPGPRMLHTDDGGNSWDILDFAFPSMIVDFHFVDREAGWALIGNPSLTGIPTGTSLWRTQDGGRRWAPVPLGSFRGSRIQFVGGDKGWIAGPSGMLHTKDGGITWERQLIASADLHDVWFADDLRGWAVGTLGTVLSTRDAGVSWEGTSVGSADTLTGVIGDASGKLVVSGSEQHLYVSEDGGRSWGTKRPPGGEFLRVASADFLSPEHAWVRTTDGLAMTTDGGESWDVHKQIHWNGTMALATVNVGYVQTANGVLWQFDRTSAEWTQPNSRFSTSGAPDTDTLCGDMHFVDADTGWISAAHRGIYATRDGGRTWRKQYTSVSIPGQRGLRPEFTYIYFATDRDGWAVCRGEFIATTDAGNTWALVAGPKRDISAMSHAGAYIWAVGPGEFIMKMRTR